MRGKCNEVGVMHDNFPIIIRLFLTGDFYWSLRNIVLVMHYTWGDMIALKYIYDKNLT